MGILPMVQVLLHFGGTPKQQSRERETFERPSLARLLDGCAVCMSTRTMGGMPMLRFSRRINCPRHRRLPPFLHVQPADRQLAVQRFGHR